MLFQQYPPEIGPYIPFIYAGITFGLMILSWIPLLKLGLIIVDGKEKREFKWVIVSACIQAGATFFIMLPIFMTGFLEEMNQGPDFGLIIGLMCLGLFIDLNIINVFHKIGIKRALVIFIIEIIPVIIIMIVMFSEVGGGGTAVY